MKSPVTSNFAIGAARRAPTTSEQVHTWAIALARLAGRNAINVSQNDYEQAKSDLNSREREPLERESEKESLVEGGVEDAERDKMVRAARASEQPDPRQP
jgi:hypothetical protein